MPFIPMDFMGTVAFFFYQGVSLLGQLKKMELLQIEHRTPNQPSIIFWQQLRNPSQFQPTFCDSVL